MQPFETSTPIKNSTSGTPMQWRLGIALVIVLIALASFFLRSLIGLKGQSVAGVIFFFGLVALFSRDLRSVNWHTIILCVALQMIVDILVRRVKVFFARISSFGV